MKKQRVAALAVICLLSLGLIQPVSAAVSSFVGKGLVIFDQIRVGKTFQRGSIMNDTKTNGVDNPVTIKDSLRVDGGIFGVQSGGQNLLNMSSNVGPSKDASYSLGSSTKRFIDLYLSGSLIGTGIVGTAAIADSAVTGLKISDGVVTSAKITDGTIVAADILDGTLTSAKLLDGTIAAADLGADAVTGAKVIDASNAAGLRKADLGVFSTVVSLDPPSLAAGTCAIVSATVTGVQATDMVFANPIDTLSNKLIAVAYDVILSNSIDFQYCNISTGTFDGADGTWRVLVIR